MSTIIGKVFESVKNIYSEINPATLTGAIDVIIVKQKDGSYQCSPFHVRFGKMGVLRSKEKVVDIEINGEPVDIHMKLGESGEAFFVEEIPAAEECPAHLATSPIPPEESEAKSETAPVTGRPETFRARASSESYAHERPLKFRCKGEARTDGDILLPSELETYNFDISSQLSRIKEAPSEGTVGVAMKDCLMGMREEGMLNALIERDAPAVVGDPVKVFRAETVQCGEILGSFKPIQESPTASAADQSEARRSVTKKKKKKRSTKKRSQRYRPQKSSISSSEDAQEPSPTNSDTSEETVLVDEEEGEKESSPELENGKSKEALIEPESRVPAIVCVESVETKVADWSSLSRGGTGFHCFSDSDLYSPNISRPGTPVLSDTEYEKQAASQDRPSLAESEQPSWKWGELPNTTTRNTPLHPPQHEAGSKEAKAEDGASVVDGISEHKKDEQTQAQRSMLSSMFNLLRQTKKSREDPFAVGGIYLDDLNLNEMDPEMAAIYFPNALQDIQHQRLNDRGHGKDDDVESGTGPSLPHSPSSSYGYYERPVGIDSDSEESRHQYRTRPNAEVSMSLCGGLEDLPEPPEDLFLQSMITYDDFVENPKVIDNPALVIRVGSKYYNRSAALPIIMSLVSFQRPLPQPLVENLVYENMTKPREEKKKSEQKPRSWWWGRSGVEIKKPEAEHASSKKADTERGTESGKEESLKKEISVDDLKGIQIEGETGAKSLDKSPKKNLRVEKLLLEARSGTSSDAESDDLNPKTPTDPRIEKCKKSLRLTSEQIAKLGLHDGANEVDFSVTTAYQGTTRCKCYIYLWKWDDKVVVSDIDGTITKSDVLGHLLPIVGRTWAQGGVTQLFTKICENGYKILYLSARAIGQAQITRDYLKSLKQGDLALPDGPVLLNPTSLMNALHREVIERKPEEFKIACLKDIQALFPSDGNPFYAGYGNRVNDVWAYTAIGIAQQRIFTINPKGELKRGYTQNFNSSYSNYSDQSSLVDHVFPPRHRIGRLEHACAEYSNFNFWKDPVIDIDPDIVQAAAAASKAGKK